HPALRRVESIYSRRSEQTKTACQRKPTAPFFRTSSERRDRKRFARLPTAHRPSRRGTTAGFHQAEKQLTFLPVLRYGSSNRKRAFKNPIHSFIFIEESHHRRGTKCGIL